MATNEHTSEGAQAAFNGEAIAAPVVPSSPTATPAAIAQDAAYQLAQAQQRIADLAAANKRLNDQEAATRIAKREAAEAREAALREQGEYKALADSLQQSTADLAAERDALRAQNESLAPLAERYARYEEQQRAAITARLPGLPEHQRVAIEAIADVNVQRIVMDGFDRTAAALATHSAPAAAAALLTVPASAGTPGAAAAPTTAVDVAKLLARGGNVAAVMSQHPAEVAALVAQASRANKPVASGSMASLARMRKAGQ